jgi:hypothetical protein
MSSHRPVLPDQLADPFQEHTRQLLRFDCNLLGARFRFESNSNALMRLVHAAYRGLPPQRFSTARTRPLTVRVMLRPHAAFPVPHRRDEPPPLDMFSAPGWLGAGSTGADVVLLSPAQRLAMVAVSPQTLGSAYHTRYELIEFAAFTLAARCQRLASLHAACVGLAGHGAVLMGDSGAGKSTVTMLCLRRGMQFLAEDSVFVSPSSLRATGVANFLHLRADSLRWLPPKQRALWRRAPVIRRRSGVRKYEIDLRDQSHCLATAPLRLRALVFLSAREAPGASLLQPLGRRATLSRLAAAQAYAARQPQWPQFSHRILTLPAFELRRGTHPEQSVDALCALLQ